MKREPRKGAKNGAMLPLSDASPDAEYSRRRKKKKKKKEKKKKRKLGKKKYILINASKVDPTSTPTPTHHRPLPGSQ